jgi:hypothetical protein
MRPELQFSANWTKSDDIKGATVEILFAPSCFRAIMGSHDP